MMKHSNHQKLHSISGEQWVLARWFWICLRTWLRKTRVGPVPYFDLNYKPPTVRIDAVDEKSHRGGNLAIAAGFGGNAG